MAQDCMLTGQWLLNRCMVMKWIPFNFYRSVELFCIHVFKFSAPFLILMFSLHEQSLKHRGGTRGLLTSLYQHCGHGLFEACLHFDGAIFVNSAY